MRHCDALHPGLHCLPEWEISVMLWNRVDLRKRQTGWTLLRCCIVWDFICHGLHCLSKGTMRGRFCVHYVLRIFIFFLPWQTANSTDPDEGT